jgi:hypothetical protein
LNRRPAIPRNHVAFNEQLGDFGLRGNAVSVVVERGHPVGRGADKVAHDFRRVAVRQNDADLIGRNDVAARACAVANRRIGCAVVVDSGRVRAAKNPVESRADQIPQNCRAGRLGVQQHAIRIARKHVSLEGRGPANDVAGISIRAVGSADHDARQSLGPGARPTQIQAEDIAFDMIVVRDDLDVAPEIFPSDFKAEDCEAADGAAARSP